MRPKSDREDQEALNPVTDPKKSRIEPAPAQTKAPKAIGDLPGDLIDKILAELEPADLASIPTVSKAFNQRLAGVGFWDKYSSRNPLKPGTPKAAWLLGRYIDAKLVDRIDYDFLWSLIMKDDKHLANILTNPILSKNQAALDRLYRHVARHYSINSISSARKSQNFTILFWACLCNQAQDVRALLKIGLGIALTIHGEMLPLGTNDQNQLLATLQFVAKNGFADVMQSLLDNGVSGRLGDDRPVSPLNVAIEFNHPAIIKALLKHGADSNGFFNGIPRLIQAANKGKIEAVKLLLEHLAHYDAISSAGETALHFAAAYGQYETAKLLLRHGANSNITMHKSKRTPLHLAVLKGNLELVNLLVIHSDNIDAAQSDGDTALILAVKAKAHEIVRSLVSHGANINAPCKNGLTPYGAALGYGDEKCLEALKISPNSEAFLIDGDTPLSYFSYFKIGLKGVKNSLKLGHDVNAANADGSFPLYIAANHGHLDIVQTLLEANADLNARIASGATPLRIAVEANHYEIVSLLLTRGANVNQANNKGTTPLWIAARDGNIKMLQLLLEFGANPSISSSQDFERIYKDAKKDSPEAMKRAQAYFKSAKTNPASISATDIAKIMGHTEVLELLKSKIIPEQESATKKMKM